MSEEEEKPSEAEEEKEDTEEDTEEENEDDDDDEDESENKNTTNTVRDPFAMTKKNISGYGGLTLQPSPTHDKMLNDFRATAKIDYFKIAEDASEIEETTNRLYHSADGRKKNLDALRAKIRPKVITKQLENEEEVIQRIYHDRMKEKGTWVKQYRKSPVKRTNEEWGETLGRLYKK